MTLPSKHGSFRGRQTAIATAATGGAGNDGSKVCRLTDWASEGAERVQGRVQYVVKEGEGGETTEWAAAAAAAREGGREGERERGWQKI